MGKSNGGKFLIKAIVVIALLVSTLWYYSKYSVETTEKYREACINFCELKELLHHSNFENKCVCKTCEIVEVKNMIYGSCDYSNFYISEVDDHNILSNPVPNYDWDIDSKFCRDVRYVRFGGQDSYLEEKYPECFVHKEVYEK